MRIVTTTLLGISILCVFSALAPNAMADSGVKHQCTVDGVSVVSNTPCRQTKPAIIIGATVSYQCQTRDGMVFQQRPCRSGNEVIHVYRDTSDAGAGATANRSVVDALNQLTARNPTASGSNAITVIGKPPRAEDGKSDGFREVDRTPKGSSY